MKITEVSLMKIIDEFIEQQKDVYATIELAKWIIEKTKVNKLESKLESKLKELEGGNK